MIRTTAIVSAAAVIVLVTGFVHGTWTQRWSQSADVEAATARLDNIPMKVGGWTAGDVEPIEPDALRAAGAEGCWMHSFTSTETGQKVLVVVLCGRTGQMCVHRPENCYPGQGFDLAGAPVNRVFKMSNSSPDAEFWTARFTRPEVTTGEVQLRIFWAWNAAGQWKAPEYPRWTFASQPYLYKLYVIRQQPLGGERPGDDPAAEFLRQFLPELTKALAPT